MRGLALAALSLVVCSPLASQEPTAVVHGDPARLVVAPPPDLLAEEALRDHLETGLTSTLELMVDARGPARHRARGGVRFDIRYELWDELYLVAVRGNDEVERQRFVSFGELTDWWGQLRVSLPLPDRSVGGRWRVDVGLRVLPFSESEQLEARTWYTRSARPAESPASGEAGADASNLGTLIELVMVTSIGRAEVLRYDWRLTVDSPGAP